MQVYEGMLVYARIWVDEGIWGSLRPASPLCISPLFSSPVPPSSPPITLPRAPYRGPVHRGSIYSVLYVGALYIVRSLLPGPFFGFIGTCISSNKVEIRSIKVKVKNQVK